MYIREIITQNKKTKKEYKKHVLVESVRTPEGPRQRTIMPLGYLDLPKSQWKALAACLERKLSGQETFIDENATIEAAAQHAIEQYKVVEQKRSDKEERKEQQQLMTIDVNVLATTYHRSLGCELVAHKTWNQLKMNKILSQCGFSQKEQALAEAVVISRLIDPGSDLNTWSWLTQRTALTEMLDVNLQGIGKDAIYEITDRLLLSKKEIEAALYKEEQKQFSTGPSIYLYDLTNTYFEGSCHNNLLAKRYKSKEKRSDCPLVALALVVDQNGFPVFSQIYKGNQPEPETLEAILKRLEEDIPPIYKNFKPTMIMDRGIATKDNIALLNEKQYPYTIIERRQAEKDYKEEYFDLNTFTQIGPDTEPVYVKKVIEDDLSKVLCLSHQRRLKENGIDSGKEERFIEELEKIKGSVIKGTIKCKEKVWHRIGRVHEKYPSVAKYYTINTQEDEKHVLNLSWDTKTDIRDERSALTGCYVIESTHKDLNATEIWQMYMTILQVESAFRALKSDLGLRPIHHQKSTRTEGHLFISVLAYHLLNTIEYQLRQQNDTRTWSTLKKVLSTHQRSTVILTDSDNKIHHIRLSGIPEAAHQDIYKKLDVPPLLKKQISYVATRL